MPLLEIKTVINSDAKICFDLARDINFHQESLKFSNQKAISGKMSGLIGLGEWVCWEAKHLGFVQHLASKITEFDPPNYFVDEMVFGVFKSFRHEHIFQEENNQTLFIDKFYFESPYGILGKMANILFVERYIVKFLKTRNEFIKAKAEEVTTTSL